MALEISKIESTEFTYPLEDVGTDEGFNLVYDPGTTTERNLFGLRIHTTGGITGEFVGGRYAASSPHIHEYVLRGALDPLWRRNHANVAADFIIAE